MNTRRYPRTIGEAFPQTALYACAVERPAAKSKAGWIVLAVIFLLLVAAKTAP